MLKPLKTTLICSGLDPSGHAGFMSDLRVMHSIGVSPLGVVTALTSQNPNHVSTIQDPPPLTLSTQLKELFSYYTIHSAKIGMLHSAHVMDEIYPYLKESTFPIVIDPVINSTSGAPLIPKKLHSKYISEILPLASLITPNLHEARYLLQDKVSPHQDLAEKLFNKWQIPVLLKGGHASNLKDQVTDILFDQRGPHHFHKSLYQGINLHGTGCFLSSAIAANLALGNELKEAIQKSEAQIEQAMKKPDLIEKEKFLGLKALS